MPPAKKRKDGPDEIARQLREDPDFIFLKRFDYSLKNLLVRYPDGVPERMAAQALKMTIDQLQKFDERINERLRGLMGVIDDD